MISELTVAELEESVERMASVLHRMTGLALAGDSDVPVDALRELAVAIDAAASAVWTIDGLRAES